MEERIFEELKDATIEELVERVNDVVRVKFSILDEDNDIEKWNRVPKLLLLEDNDKEKVLKFVEFMDTLLIPIEDKVMYVVSLCGLLEYGNIKLNEYDEGSLFTLADFYKDSNIDEIKNTLSIVGNKDILLAVRNKTIDIEARNKILENIVKSSSDKKINVNKKTDYDKFISDTIEEINEKDFYDLVK